MQKTITKLLYKDAIDTNENIGGSLEAYFDKEKNRWVFPGEGAAAEDDPSSRPPPMTPVAPSALAKNEMAQPAGSSSYGASSSSGRSVGGNGSGAGAEDPLAALMAPPSRALSHGGGGSYPSALASAASSGKMGAEDPLAALMAPPVRSVSTSSVPPAPAGSPYTLLSPAAGMNNTPSYTNFSVFTPKASAVAATAGTVSNSSAPAPAGLSRMNSDTSFGFGSGDYQLGGEQWGAASTVSATTTASSSSLPPAAYGASQARGNGDGLTAMTPPLQLQANRQDSSQADAYPPQYGYSQGDYYLPSDSQRNSTFDSSREAVLAPETAAANEAMARNADWGGGATTQASYANFAVSTGNSSSITEFEAIADF